MKTKCLIVDDEPLAVEVIENHLSKIEELELAGTCKNAFEVYNFLRETKVDLMFLDIHMPEMKGTELIKNLKNPPKVILTTAYREYALEGYELNVLDYLLKPISFDRFMQAINKYFDSASASSDISFHANNSHESFIYVREKNQVHKILTNNIHFIESISDYVKIHSSNQKITIRYTISSIEKMLLDAEFVRIHRSYIVNKKYITKFTAHSIYIEEKEFPIGPSYKKEVFNALNYGKFLD
ncbi:MAG: response regulator transcription factor [Chloroflexia bacterium]|nr:response regulator transcription factor [Chloroflexia bacterium]